MGSPWDNHHQRHGVTMPYNAAGVAVALLLLGGLLAVPGVRGPLGLGLDDSWQLALIHIEVALAPFIFMVRRGGREAAAANLASAAACWVVGAAVVLLFSFAAISDAGLATRGLSAAVWLACGGLLALGARLGATQLVRVLLVACFALPLLWHYFGLEYGGVSLSHLRGLSPNWALAAGVGISWPLAVAGALAGALSLALPVREAP